MIITQDNIRLAGEIRTARAALRNDGQNWQLAVKLNDLSGKFRTQHIAHCLLRDTPYEAIENKVREDNTPD